MNIIIIDLLFIALTIAVLAIAPMYSERKQHAAWQGKMKRAALRHGNSEYGQERYRCF